MTTKLPLELWNPAQLEEIPRYVWEQLFNAVGWPEQLDSTTFVVSDVPPALQKNAREGKTLQLCLMLWEFGTEAGREAVLERLTEGNCKNTYLHLQGDFGAAEFAARLFLEQEQDEALQKILVRARLQTERQTVHRVFHEFAGPGPREAKLNKKVFARLEKEIRAHCANKGYGSYAEVLGFADEGFLFFSLCHSSPTRAPMVIQGEKQQRSQLRFRPVHGDVAEYDQRNGRLRVAARSPSMIPIYRRLFGEVLFKNPDFFSADAICSLEVLQLEGEDALRSKDFKIGQVSMSECVWEIGDRTSVRLWGSDCFRTLKDEKLSIEAGRMTFAKLKVPIIRAGGRPVVVEIRVPNRIKISRPEHRKVIESYLEAIGIKDPPEAHENRNLWTLYPWRHSEKNWKTHLGSEMGYLVQAGALEPVDLDRVSHPEYPQAGRILKVTELENGDFFGVSTEDGISSIQLSPTDIQGRELQPEKLVEDLRRQWGLAGLIKAPAHSSLLDLGMFQDQNFETQLVLVVKKPEVGDLVTPKSRSQSSTFIFPPGTRPRETQPSVVLERWATDRRELLRQLLEANGQLENVPIGRWRSLKNQIVVDARFQEIWVDEVLIENIPPMGRHFLTAMAKRPGQVVSHETIAKEVSGRDPKTMDGLAAARESKSKATKAIKAAFEAVGRQVPKDLFPSAGTSTYKCRIGCFYRPPEDRYDAQSA